MYAEIVGALLEGGEEVFYLREFCGDGKNCARNFVAKKIKNAKDFSKIKFFKFRQTLRGRAITVRFLFAIKRVNLLLKTGFLMRGAISDCTTKMILFRKKLQSG